MNVSICDNKKLYFFIIWISAVCRLDALQDSFNL